MTEGIIGGLIQIIGEPNNFGGEIFLYAVSAVLFIILFVCMFLIPIWLLKRH